MQPSNKDGGEEDKEEEMENEEHESDGATLSKGGVGGSLLIKMGEEWAIVMRGDEGGVTIAVGTILSLTDEWGTNMMGGGEYGAGTKDEGGISLLRTDEWGTKRTGGVTMGTYGDGKGVTTRGHGGCTYKICLKTNKPKIREGK